MRVLALVLAAGVSFRGQRHRASRLRCAGARCSEQASAWSSPTSRPFVLDVDSGRVQRLPRAARSQASSPLPASAGGRRSSSRTRERTHGSTRSAGGRPRDVARQRARAWCPTATAAPSGSSAGTGARCTLRQPRSTAGRSARRAVPVRDDALPRRLAGLRRQPHPCDRPADEPHGAEHALGSPRCRGHAPRARGAGQAARAARRGDRTEALRWPSILPGLDATSPPTRAAASLRSRSRLPHGPADGRCSTSGCSTCARDADAAPEHAGLRLATRPRASPGAPTAASSCSARAAAATSSPSGAPAAQRPASRRCACRSARAQRLARTARLNRGRWAILDSNQGPPPYQSGALTS